MRLSLGKNPEIGYSDGAEFRFDFFDLADMALDNVLDRLALDDWSVLFRRWR
jgi:hypothetical protein